MRSILAAVMFTAALGACTKPSELQGTVAPPGPPPPAGDEKVVVKTPPKSLEIQADVIRLKPGITIRFETDSDKIEPDSTPILDEVAMVMTENTKIRIRVEGHTDNTGGADHNQDLSNRRSASVRTYLEAKGLPAERLASIGCGEGVPAADNTTEDGRAQNRRVEFVIVRHRHPRGNCELYKPGASNPS